MPVQTRPRKHLARRQPVMEVENDHGQTRLNKLEFDENDEKIINATLKAFESGSLTPLIKEELRCTIQSRRLAEGKGEMKVEFKAPVRKKEMDDDERRRALKRRQQNREAAQRFRQKQKDTSDYLTAKIRRLEKSANSLTDQMSRLREEKELLGQMLKDHLTVCSNPQHIMTDSTFQFNSANNTTAHDHTTTNNTFADFETNLAISHAQELLSQSSVDTSLTGEFTPNTAASDTSSVFFPDSNSDLNQSNHDHYDNFESYENYTPPPQPDTQDRSNSPENCINPSDMQFSPPISTSTTINNMPTTTQFTNLDKLSIANTITTVPPPINNTSDNNNVIVYDGPLDACYEEVIIDFSDEDAEFLRNDGRTRGDSCSSVDTVASLYSASTTGSELTPIKETTTDVVVPQLNTQNVMYAGTIDLSTLSAYSGIHSIIDPSSFTYVPCGKTMSLTDDFLLMDEGDI